MTTKKTIENIILTKNNFTIIVKGEAAEMYSFSNLEKVYVRVSNKNTKQLFVISTLTFIIFIILLYTFYDFSGLVLGMSTSVFTFSFLNSILKKKYDFIVKLNSGIYEEYKINPQYKFRLLDKMRIIRASLYAYKMSRVN